jgi:hypothetical protein
MTIGCRSTSPGQVRAGQHVLEVLVGPDRRSVLTARSWSTSGELAQQTEGRDACRRPGPPVERS